MKSHELNLDASDVSYEAALALDLMEEGEDVTPESLIRGLFAALKLARTNQRRLDALLLAKEGELPEKLRALGVDCSDEEVYDLMDAYGHSYCW